MTDGGDGAGPSGATERGTESGGERMVPFFCPYCGEESLRPLSAEPGGYRCPDCRRTFRLRFLGLAGSGG